MCVIIVCPKGVKTPSKKVLNSIWHVNSHGFGFVSDTRFYKGLDFDAFMKKLSEVDEGENRIIHLRYATHGSIKASNCHPFENNGLYFAHNGVLPIKSVNDMTDSEIAFREKIYPAFQEFGFDSEKFDSICREVACYSKFAFLNDGKLKLIGTYYEHKGVYYSNLRFNNNMIHDNKLNVVNM